MPGEKIHQPNPPPLPSNLTAELDGLQVRVKKKTLDTKEVIRKWQRAANYLAAAMIFLQDNVLLKDHLSVHHIKPRLLGHWGTCPGLTLVYAHLNRIIIDRDLDMLYVVGPGHGAPSILANLWMEGSLQKYYPKYSRNIFGLKALVTQFSTPIGFPSHVNAETPGAIHEGGELGYALSISYGAAMDNPDLIVTCIVGDGEAETGPTATAWHGHKFLDPAESGAVLPILHVNGFKISERTIFGCMDDRELIALFSGYGYQPCIVEELEDIDTDLSSSLDWAVDEIRKIQGAARTGNPIVKPRWPVIILRTPKGWTGPKQVHGTIIEGSFASHQVPLPNAKHDEEELQVLEEWLKSYRPEDVFSEYGDVSEDLKKLIPSPGKALGQRKEAHEGHEPIKVVDWKELGVDQGVEESCMKMIGRLLDRFLVANPKTLRIFSPDELVSNKLDAVFEHTGRNFQCDEYSRAQGGRVIETLSEHQCQGFLQGYTITGRTGLFPSYESFLGIIHTMIVQYSKFTKIARECHWRNRLSSINYVETSTWARQEHNGFSHQNPSFIGAVLNLKPAVARVYLPPDANTFMCTVAHCLESKDYVNLIVGSKQPTPVYFSPEMAETHCRAGGGILGFASTDGGLDPDVVLVGIGPEVTFEVVKAALLLRQRIPEFRIRTINVTDIMILSAPPNPHPHALSDADYASMFAPEIPIHINYHGYAQEIKGLIFGRPHRDITIASYIEEGSTTTPFDMMLVNQVSRYHVAQTAVRGAATRNKRVDLRRHELLTELEQDIRRAKEYILKHGVDPDGIYDLAELH